MTSVRGVRVLARFGPPKPLGLVSTEYHPERSVRWNLLDSDIGTIDGNWEAVAASHGLYDGNLFHVEEHYPTENCGYLFVGHQARYREHQAEADVRDHGLPLSEDAQMRIAPFAVCAMAVTADGKVPVRKRTEILAPNLYDCSVSGLCVVKERKVDPAATIIKVLERELGVRDGDVADTVVTGLIQNLDYHDRMLCHVVELNRSSAEIANRKPEVRWVDVRALRKFIEEHYQECLDDLVGTAILGLPINEALLLAGNLNRLYGSSAVTGISGLRYS